MDQLPQGMKNSPILCQIYVFSALKPLLIIPDLMVVHYMDSNLVVQSKLQEAF